MIHREEWVLNKFIQPQYYILTLDRAVNQRCTCVDKRKKSESRWALGKNIGMVPTAGVGSVGDRECQSEDQMQIGGYGSQRPPVEQPKPRWGRSAAMVKRRTWSIQQSVPVSTHFSHTTEHHPFENEVWDLYFCREVYSFVIEVVHYRWLFLYVYFYIA